LFIFDETKHVIYIENRIIYMSQEVRDALMEKLHALEKLMVEVRDALNKRENPFAPRQLQSQPQEQRAERRDGNKKLAMLALRNALFKKAEGANGFDPKGLAMLLALNNEYIDVIDLLYLMDYIDDKAYMILKVADVEIT